MVSDGDGQVRVLGGEGEHNGSLTDTAAVLKASVHVVQFRFSAFSVILSNFGQIRANRYTEN